MHSRNQNKTYMIVGELSGMPTRFNSVKLFNFDTFNISWVSEAELLNIMSSGGRIVNLNSISNNLYRIPVYKLDKNNQRRLIHTSNPEMGVALAVLTEKLNAAYATKWGLLIHRAPNSIQFIKMKNSSRWIDNVQNLGISPIDGVSASELSEWSIVYKEEIPTIQIDKIGNSARSKVQVVNTYNPSWI